MQLYVLDFGLFQVHENGRIIGIPGFLIRASSGEVILVDTGFPARYADDPRTAAREDGLDWFGTVVHLTRRNLPAAQLALAGVAPEEVTHLVLTHTHIDHVGGIAQFPQAVLVIGRAERELPHPLYWGTRKPLNWPEQQYLLIDADTQLCPGVTLLATPGHSPGHLALLLELPYTGPVLLTADAISRPDDVIQDAFDGAWNPAQARRHAGRLLRIAEQQRAWVIYGHDPAQWHELRKAPQFYD
jgi:N-acyl homoserine lactone hydrolase